MSKIQDILQMTPEASMALAHSRLDALDAETMGQQAFEAERKRISIENIYAPNLIRRLSKRFEGEWTDADTDAFYERIEKWGPAQIYRFLKETNLTKTFYESDQVYSEEENMNTKTLDDYRRQFGIISENWSFGGRR